MKTLLKYIVLVCLAAVLVLGVAWASHKADFEVCTAIDIEIINADSTSFVTQQGILGEMNRLGLKAVGLPMGKIDTDRIENLLRESVYLESAECVKCSNNHLVVRVKQIVPVLRVFDGNSSYYMNKEGKRMESNPNFLADVPVVQGNFSKQFPPTRLLPLVEHVDADPMLRQLVTMISVRDSNNIFIIPSIYGHVVNVGPPNNLESKFNRLTAFYRKVMPYKGYNYYDTISVKWNHQVVGTKRHKKVKVVILPDSTDVVDDGPTLQSLQGDGTTN